MKKWSGFAALLLAAMMSVGTFVSCDEPDTPAQTGAQSETKTASKPEETGGTNETNGKPETKKPETDKPTKPEEPTTKAEDLTPEPEKPVAERLEYTLLDDDTYEVSGIGSAENESEIVISATYNGKAVTSIGDYAFWNCYGLTSITIPDSVTSIGNSVFFGCSSLTSITIPDSATSIGDYAFFDCSGLTSITIPNSVTSIGGSAFSGCSGLTRVYITDLAKWCGITFADYNANPLSGAHSLYLNGTLVTNLEIPDGVTSIGSGAFSGCSGLTEITIPNSVTSIGSSAFRGCSSLTSVTIPDSVTSIGEGAFSGCSGLTSITIPFVGATKDGTENTCFWYIFGFGYSYNDVPSSLKTVVITGGTSVGDSAFWNCSGLTEITIPNSVTSIDGSAFSGCYKLVEVYNKSALNITAGSWENGDVGYYAKAVYTQPYTSKLSTDENGYILYTDGDKISLIGYTGTETKLTLPSGITEINRYAFYGCRGLTSITIGNGVTSIGKEAFYRCSGLTSITIPDSVTSIGKEAFYRCSGLTSITIPDSVTSIGENAFYGCYELTRITYLGTMEQWNAISKGYLGRWSGSVVCSDGTISIEY